MRVRIPLSANVPTRQTIRGQGVVIASLGVAATVDFALAGTDWQDMESYGKCERLFGVYDPQRLFTGVELTAPVDCVVELIVSRSQIKLMDGANVTATIDAAQLPLPVATSRGTAPGNPFFVSGITYNDTPAAARVENAAVAIGGAGASVLLAANVNRLRAVFTNIGTTDPVTIGSPAITWAKRVIVLQPGDSWVEEKGAALAWSAITDIGKAASVTVQELTS